MNAVGCPTKGVRTPCNAHFTTRSPSIAMKAQNLASTSSSFATSSLSFNLRAQVSSVSQTRGRQNLVVIAGNNAADGPFTPIVKVVRNAMGVKEFNQLRGKAISLHSQVIKDFCKQIGVDNKQVQGLIRLAKKNGEKLGFLS